ncbi:unnamed protein product [Effrenium voratum]|nr:unnamed protein product [Effrenium voratum]
MFLACPIAVFAQLLWPTPVMASLVAGLFVSPPHERVGRGVADFCCAQRRPSPPPEQHLAKVLTAKVQRYCTAVESRRENLAAVDGFYRELMVCQWRVEAIEAQQRALAVPADAGGGAADSLGEAVAAALVELSQLREGAVAGLEERATHYALLAEGHTAHTEAERDAAMGCYRQLVAEVFTEASAEMQGLLEARGCALGLLGSLERRRSFWARELEETWAAWHDATARMHTAGYDALCAWREIAEVLESACQHFERLQDGGQKVIAKPELREALVTFAARSLELELTNSLGLSGLHGGESPGGSDRFALETRLDMLTSVLQLLEHLKVLDRVGEALLRPGVEDMPLPTSRAAARLAGRTKGQALAQAGLRLKSEDFSWMGSSGESARVLLPWFIDCVVEAVAAASQRQKAQEDASLPFTLWKRLDFQTVESLLDSCRALGGEELAAAVQGAAAPQVSEPRSLRQLTRELSTSEFPDVIQRWLIFVIAAESLSIRGTAFVECNALLRLIKQPSDGKFSDLRMRRGMGLVRSLPGHFRLSAYPFEKPSTWKALDRGASPYKIGNCRCAACLATRETLRRLLRLDRASFRHCGCGRVDQVLEVATKDSSTRSKANVKEAERCARLAAEIAARAGAKSVAVLSWYNAQVVELKSWLRHLGARGVHCGSVVTAQGSEWDYVLLSTVLNSSLEVRLGCLADKHLLNVAVSRGRVGLVVLGRPEVLRTDRHWAAFLEHCEGLGGMLQDGDEPTLSGEPRAVAAKQEPLVQVPKQQFYPPLRAAQAPVGETQRLAEATRDFCRHLEERSDFRFQ